MKRKKYLAVLLTASMLLSLSACGNTGEPGGEAAETGTEVAGAETTEVEQVSSSLDASLDLNNYADQWIYVTEMEKTERGEVVLNDDGTPVMQEVQPCYALKNLVYCTNPADAAVQIIDIYVPAEYMDAVDNGDGTFTCTVKAGGVFKRADGTSYTAENAPIVYQNTIDGYAEGAPLQLTSGRKGNGVGTYNNYLESGYVLVSIGCRGITSEVDGTAPAAVVDLKAGIRYLKANAAVLPGDTEKIIVTGTSAGGGVSSVVGASGNSDLYTPYLEEIGAVMDSTDDVYSVMAFCPITNLGTADAAYEWLHATETKTSGGFGGFGGPGGNMGGGAGGPGGAGEAGGNMGGGAGDPGGAGGEDSEKEFSEFEVALHEALYEQYITDLQELGIDPEAFYAGFLDEINECIDYYVVTYVEDVDAFVAENAYLSYDGENVSADTVDTFVAESMSRSKGAPSFDGLERENRENELFDGKHFSMEMLTILEELSGEYEEAAEVLDAYKAEITEERLEEVRLMTPNTFLSGEESAAAAPYWRFRIGTTDGDLGAVSAWTMTQLLQENQNVKDVDYGLVWGVGHMAADYSYEDVQTYIDSICQ